MCTHASFTSHLCGIASSVFLAGIVLISPDSVLAQTSSPSTAPNSSSQPGTMCTCPTLDERPKLWPKPKFAELRPHLDGRDELAALEAVHIALTEVGDGSSYVWHQRNGRLSGVVRPTSSFRDATGKVCRHIVLALSSEGFARSTEGIACRLASGAWQLDG